MFQTRAGVHKTLAQGTRNHDALFVLDNKLYKVRIQNTNSCFSIKFHLYFDWP